MIRTTELCHSCNSPCKNSLGIWYLICANLHFCNYACVQKFVRKS